MKKYMVLLLLYMSPSSGVLVVGPEVYQALIAHQLTLIHGKYALIGNSMGVLSNSLLKGLNMDMVDSEHARSLIEKIQEELDEVQVLINRLRKLLPKKPLAPDSSFTDILFVK